MYPFFTIPTTKFLKFEYICREVREYEAHISRTIQQILIIFFFKMNMWIKNYIHINDKSLSILNMYQSINSPIIPLRNIGHPQESSTALCSSRRS